MMQVQVLGVRTVAKGLRIAHVQAASFYGDVPAANDVQPGAPGWLRVRLVCQGGRLGATLKVESKEQE